MHFTRDTLKHAVIRPKVCTLILAAAREDADAHAYIDSGLFQEVAAELAQRNYGILNRSGVGPLAANLIDSGFIRYTPDGEHHMHSLPPVAEAWKAGAIGSYEVRLFRGGDDLGPVDTLRHGRGSVEDICEHIEVLCNHGRPVQSVEL